MPFNFDDCVTRYVREAAAEGKYPREKSWDYLWDYFQPSTETPDGRASLVCQERLELTALHIGFYLASWGMFRGSGALLYQNLDFFKNLAIHLLTAIPDPDEFWTLQFARFRDSEETVKLFDRVRGNLTDFLQTESEQQNVDLIVGKLLLGTWGQCPAVDDYFHRGLIAVKRELEWQLAPALNGRLLRKLATEAHSRHWNCNRERDNGSSYPAGKIIDMAFHQYGRDFD